MGQARLLIGVNVFWLALSLLVDGLNTLVLPHRLLALVGEATPGDRAGVGHVRRSGGGCGGATHRRRP